ncbi:hypothetical protein EN788_19535 [Mesorhizobium sp. M2D.F.Ca.ET.145.01.1.1]|uniref:hypothetical protein n=1 Tax=Mesorhizobium sp. M2D.F.Ca.ET.223.01.1.1 TaxID=2563940 RepID=UPI000FC9E937|nr:hypothetical protein [Mesorhizobium sp. M2D.F.Ca.ET.223.01.1.1]TGU12949.1 hypothetical protein EN806_16415 [bacterium M00.F.Ca.ET.163.01.1.1]TGV69175.1 hypothetical protein EN803_15825 [Mesorhizobium sp. M2D.F.Ca.ET.160.01.1.1]TGV76299.1 hypothetical protein EN792_052850 [Mesorhizobium sp. M00.F.Ca.ET.149.01.1.1]TGW10678.1 hypothetical protein EN788_19535 [Mesorhizobium sp. M2D.F.Ca.ET.145.01.1.1]
MIKLKRSSRSCYANWLRRFEILYGKAMRHLSGRFTAFDPPQDNSSTSIVCKGSKSFNDRL